MTKKKDDRDSPQPEGPFFGRKFGDKIVGEQIFIQARRIECHKRPRAYSTHKRNTACAEDSAEAWVTKELRYGGK